MDYTSFLRNSYCMLGYCLYIVGVRTLHIVYGKPIKMYFSTKNAIRKQLIKRRNPFFIFLFIYYFYIMYVILYNV